MSAITIEINYNHGQSRAAIDLKREDIREFFGSPIRECTNPISIANVLIADPTPKHLRLRQLKDREAFAAFISEQLIEFLLNHMAANDTVNGYRSNER